MNREDLRGRQAWHAQHLEQALGCNGPELLEVQRLTMLDEIADDGKGRRTESAHRRELAASQGVAEIVGLESAQGASGGVVRASLEAILAVQLEIRRDLTQHMRRRPRINRQRYSSTPARSLRRTTTSMICCSVSSSSWDAPSGSITPARIEIAS